MLRNFFIIAVLLAGASVAHAQSVVPDPVQYTVVPESPGPNQLVNIQVEGVGQFLGNSTITWQQNGTAVSEAQNKTRFSFTTGGIGAVTIIRLTIDSPTQGVITHDFVFNPSVVNMVWEADTSVPLLYKGKPLYSAGSNLTVAAFPMVIANGSLMPASKLSFQWTHNDAPVPEASGLGKNTFSFLGDQLQLDEQVSVTMYSGTTAVGRGDITIPASAPRVLMYMRDPLRGELLGSALTAGVSLTETEATFKAEPYFFANSSVKNNRLVYNWSLNDQETTGPESGAGILTLRQTGEGGGRAQLSVSIQNTDINRLVQSASASLQLLFGQQSGSAFSSFFGL